MSIIATVGLTKKFGNFTANDHIDLSVAPQEIKCIVGENGAGKSTLMNMLYGSLPPTSGKILIDGQEVRFRSPLDAIACGIGMVHQHFKLVPSLTVYENILLGAEIQKKTLGIPFIDRDAEIKSVQALIDKYHFQLDPLARVADLSVGLCQQLEILKMLQRNVRILILDEPTSVLTPQEVDRLMDNLKELKAAGKTILVITHKLREVMGMSDSVTVIKQGKVVGNVKTAETDEKQLAQMMVGRDVLLTVTNDENTSGISTASNPVYRVKDLRTVNDLGQEVLSGISFDVHKGEVFGIAGVEGNGQSELVKVLTGLMIATHGSVSIDGKDITNQWPDRLRKQGVGIIPEDRYAQGLCREMSIPENCIAGYLGDKEICTLGVFRRNNIRKRRDHFVAKYDIRLADKEGSVSQLSGGNAQKIIIARELDKNPRLIIAGQPTRGVDIGSIEFIHKQLLSFRNKGHSVLLISSELSEIMSLSDRVAVMYRGEIVDVVDPKHTSTQTIGLLMAGEKPAV